MSESNQEWLVALIHDVRSSGGVLYQDLGAALRAVIASGEVPVGARLPPERELARRLSIGRTTVVAAYNLLRAESLIVTRQRAGAWVVRRPKLAAIGSALPPTVALVPAQRLSRQEVVGKAHQGASSRTAGCDALRARSLRCCIGSLFHSSAQLQRPGR